MTCDLQASTSIRTGDMRFAYYSEGNGGQTPLPMPALAVGGVGADDPSRVASDVQEMLIERCGH